MSPNEVEALIGPPLDRVTAPNDSDRVEWNYSRQIHHTRNYFQRSVVFHHDKVWYVVMEYWVD